MKIDMNYLLDKLNELLLIPSPSGNTEKAIAFVEKEFKAMGISSRRTKKGALVATMVGETTDEERTLSAHVDTLGAMVKEIKSDGTLKFTQIGGYPWNAVEGEHCQIETIDGKIIEGSILLSQASSHVHGGKVGDAKRSADTLIIRIDEVVKSKEDVLKLGIQVGDFVFLDPRTKLTEAGFVKSRHLDDKACVACILAMVKHLVDHKVTPKYTTNFFISNYEEVGHGSSASIPEKTSEFIAIDMAAPGEGQTSDEYSVTICAKDSSGPYDLELKKRLVHLATKHKLPFVIDIYPYYGSDASAALRAGWEFKHGLIGPGVAASHSHERLHKDSLEATTRLGILYMTN